MSLKNVDINYGFNGEPSTASVSAVVNVKTCGGGSSSSFGGGMGSSVSTGNQVIDSMLEGFVISEVKTSKEGGYEGKSFGLVDKYAKKLESIPVLVRGITASPKGDPYKFYGKVYYNSETGLIGGDYYGDEHIIYENGVLVIGRTFSVVTAQVDSPPPENSQESKEEAFTRFYSRGEIVGIAPKGIPPLEIIEKFQNNDTSVSLKYGYYLTDLKKAIEACGYVVEDFPSDSNFAILDNGGSLKDCISAVASMYGLYWNCRSNQIKFFPSSEISGLSIQDFNSSTDPDILSASYSIDGIGKKKIGVITGTTASEDFPSQFGGGSQRGINISFGLLKLDEILSENPSIRATVLIKRFLSYFLFGGSENTFDLLFWGNFFSDGQDEITQRLYPHEPTTRESKTLGSFDKDSAFSLSKLAPHDKNFYYISRGLAVPLPNPSKESIYAFLKDMCSSVASIYISKPVSKYRSEKYSIVVQDGFSVSPPYKADKTIDTIDGLSNFAAAMKILADAAGVVDYQHPTIKQLFLKSLSDTHYSQNLLEDGYYYVGTKTFTNEPENYQDARTSLDLVVKTTPATMPLEFVNDLLFACGVGRATAITNALKSSFDLYNLIVKDTKKTVKMKAFRIRASDPDPDPASNEKDIELYQREIKSFQVRMDSTSDLSSLEFVTFDGSIDEAKYISSNFQKLTNNNFNLESSSVTYLGIKQPDFNDPLLDSISITFSNGAAETSISYSKKDFLGVEQNVLLAGRVASSTNNFKRNINARQKNFLSVN